LAQILLIGDGGSNKAMSLNKIILTNNLKHYFSEIKKHKLLSKEEEFALAEKIEKGGRDAFNKLVNCNLRLVVNIAKKYQTKEWKLADLIQEGNIGLITAVKKFDYRKNFRFSTYACWWIKQAILRSITNKRRTIRLPYRKEEKIKKINNAIDELYQELTRKPTVKEIADRLGFDKADVSSLKSINEKIVSIDFESMNDFENNHCISNNSSETPEAILIKNYLVDETNNVLKKLQDDERRIILSRFAFERRKKQTLKSLAKELGISPETVRQIEIRTIKKIKENYSYLKDYLYC
jgi:RNA polymerase primary sigma factor